MAREDFEAFRGDLKEDDIALLIKLNTKTQAVDEINMQYLSGAINRAVEKKLDVITIFFSMIRDWNAEEIEDYFRSQSIEGIIIYGMGMEDMVLHQLIEEKTGINTVVADDPLSAVAIGTGRFIELANGEDED